LSRLRLTINSDLRDVVYVGLMVSTFCQHLRMDPVASGQVEICAVEAVTNAIRHAYRNESGNEVSITLAVRHDQLEVEIAHTGLAMPPAARDRLTNGSNVFGFDPHNVDSVPESGMGLQIIRDVMDEVSYKSENEVHTLQLLKLMGGVMQGQRQTPADDTSSAPFAAVSPAGMKGGEDR
jgi:serine/threonine-protein kinase RsbW